MKFNLAVLLLTLLSGNALSETLIEHQGRTYRIEPDSTLHQIKVYSELDQKPYPTSLVIVLNRKDHTPWRIRLNLTETTRDSVVYTGLMPSKILVSGGIRFEIGSSK
jgi:hypothetical protein